MDTFEPTEGVIIVDHDIYVRCPHQTRMIKTVAMIEIEVNDLIGSLWDKIESKARRAHAYDKAQHNLCHLAAEVYTTFHELALKEYTVTGNPSLWELVETLTDKILACDDCKVRV